MTEECSVYKPSGMTCKRGTEGCTVSHIMPISERYPVMVIEYEVCPACAKRDLVEVFSSDDCEVCHGSIFIRKKDSP